MTPMLSVVLVTPDGFESIQRTIGYLRAQTMRDQIELLIVAPCEVRVALDDPVVARAVAGLAGVRVVSVESVVPSGTARAAGVRAAAAPVVVFAEDHCFPDPGWAAALVAAHRGGWAAVGPVIRNANPETLVSWADLLIAYGPWLEPGRPGAVSHLPGHNSSYKRERLLELGAELEALLEAETVLHWELRRRGYQLYLEPAAKAAHMNFAVWRAWVVVQVLQARMFAATRAERWSGMRRLVFVAGAPLIPFVRLSRIVRSARRSGVSGLLLTRVLPTLLAGLVLDGAGQLLGYALGAGTTRERVSCFHYHRERYVPSAQSRGAAPVGSTQGL